jgi:hypothetical protein
VDLWMPKHEGSPCCMEQQCRFCFALFEYCALTSSTERHRLKKKQYETSPLLSVLKEQCCDCEYCREWRDGVCLVARPCML